MTDSRRMLRAGPLEAFLYDGDLRRIRLGEHEIVRRVYMALRDQNWDTIPGQIENLKVEQHDAHFAVGYDSIHRRGDVDFRWRATIIGTDAGKITIAMDGKAYSTFKRNRIGFCVHHPLAPCAGKRCLVEHTDRTIERTKFPELVAPHQPFLDIRAMTHEVMPGVEAEVRFHGEIFETEDHRNWTDAGFKTYGTPLHLPFPVEIKEGTETHQMIEITLRGAARPQAAPKGGVVQISAGTTRTKLPKIGLGLNARRPMSSTEADQLKQLRLAHLRANVNLSGDGAAALQEAAAEAARLGLKVEAAVTFPGDAAALSRFAPLVERWLIYSRNEKVASPATVETAITALGPSAVIVAGTDAFFAELNRNRPAPGPYHAASFSLNPQVHATDDWSVMENVEGQFDPVRTARGFLDGKPVVVSPVTLRMRANPEATTAVEPPPPDPRQKTEFCAAWTVGSLKSLAESGAASVTYFETHGPGGVLDGGTLFPVYEVFRRVGEFAGGDVIPTRSSDTLRVTAVLLASGKKRRMLVANLTDEPQKAQISGRKEIVELSPYKVEAFDWNEE